MKRKTLTLAISVFALLAIISVGFASWVITRPKQTADAGGSITVETVEGEVNYLKSAVVEGQIHFGRPATMSNTNAWLTSNAADTEKENLTVNLKITLSAQLKDGEQITLSIAPKSEDVKKYTEAVTGEYIKTPVFTKKVSLEECTSLTKDDFTQDGDVFVANVNIKFGWGTKFGNVNPYEYYNNNKEFNEANVKEATDALKALHQFNNCNYVVTVVFPANA